MTSRSRSIVRWELFGTLFVVLVGSGLHFVFDWTGGWHPVALIAAVNESIWEHLKLAFWPGLFWALLPRPALDPVLPMRLATKGYSLLVTAAVIVIVFKTYTAILGRNLLFLDIGTFVLAVLVGQTVSALLEIRNPRNAAFLTIGLALLVMQIIAYGSFTFHPPDHWLFTDSRNGLQGLPQP